MNPFALAEQLLAGVRLSPGQVAQLRAINSQYYTHLAALEGSAGADDGGLAALRSLITAEIRDMLTDEQRVAFDRNLPRGSPEPMG